MAEKLREQISQAVDQGSSETNKLRTLVAMQESCEESTSNLDVQEAMNDAQEQFLTMMEVRRVLKQSFVELSEMNKEVC